MHDLSIPFTNVWHAFGPGCNPLRTYHPCYSQSSTSHGALEFNFISSLSLGIVISPMVGDRFALRVFQSPHTTNVVWCGIHPIISSIRLFVISSSYPRFCRLCTGGIYTLPTHSFSPPCTCKHTPCANSFPMYLKIFMPFLMITAIPPLLPLSLRCSIT